MCDKGPAQFSSVYRDPDIYSCYVDKIKAGIPNEIVNHENAVIRASCLPGIYVGQALLNQTALLLPQVYERVQAK